MGIVSSGASASCTVYLFSLYFLLFHFMISVTEGVNLRIGHDPRLLGSKTVPPIAIEHSTILGNLWNKDTDQCVSLQFCSDRCEAYVLNVVHSISSRRHTDGKLDLFMLSNRKKEKIKLDHFVCMHGCCMRSNANYILCAERCNKNAKIEDRATRRAEYTLCTLGCQMRCGMEHMDKIASSEGKCDDKLLVVKTQPYLRNSFQKMGNVFSKITYDNSVP